MGKRLFHRSKAPVRGINFIIPRTGALLRNSWFFSFWPARFLAIHRPYEPVVPIAG